MRRRFLTSEEALAGAVVPKGTDEEWRALNHASRQYALECAWKLLHHTPQEPADVTQSE